MKEYVGEYTIRKDVNKRYKSIFFYTFMSVLLGIVLSSIFFICVAACQIGFENASATIGLLIGIITAAATLITAIIVIPKIIAKYLFAIEEDKYMAEIVKAMLTQDDSTREKLDN